MIGLSKNRLEEGRWSEGRPVFKKVDGEPRFLSLKEGSSSWITSSSTTGTGAHIASRRATNSPASPGDTMWAYNIGGKFAQGDISVTCPETLTEWKSKNEPTSDMGKC